MVGTPYCYHLGIKGYMKQFATVVGRPMKEEEEEISWEDLKLLPFLHLSLSN